MQNWRPKDAKNGGYLLKTVFGPFLALFWPHFLQKQRAEQGKPDFWPQNFNFGHFWTIFDPFLTIFWPHFWHHFLTIFSPNFDTRFCNNTISGSNGIQDMVLPFWHIFGSNFYPNFPWDFDIGEAQNLEPGSNGIQDREIPLFTLSGHSFFPNFRVIFWQQLDTEVKWYPRHVIPRSNGIQDMIFTKLLLNID